MRIRIPVRIVADLGRFLAPFLIGLAVMAWSRDLALALNLPALAIAGLGLGIGLVGVAWSHPLRRLLFPYVELKRVFTKAMESSGGAGHVWLGVCIVIASAIMAMSGAHAQDLPPNARQYLPVLIAEYRAHWPDAPSPAALAAQVEQETCPSLKHRMCWSPRAELRTSREQGVGLPQITRAFRPDGSLRFDSLAELRAQFPKQLAGWDWESDTLYDPAYQLRGLILMDRRNWVAIVGAATPDDRLRMALAAYNGGLRGLANDRALCAGTRGCDPSRWVDHVAQTCTKATVAAKGYGKSFCDINREYPANIVGPRRIKYLTVLGA